MSVTAQPYGSFAPRPVSVRGGMGVVNFVLGLLVVFGLVLYGAWLVVAAVSAITGSDQPSYDQHSSDQHSAAQHVGDSVAGSSQHTAALAPVRTAEQPTPSGATLPFDQLWISGDGNTIVAGAPMVGISALTGESLIQIPVTLTNNGEQNWSPGSADFLGTLDQAPVAESTEGDWMYRSPIVPHTSVTLNKVFVGTPGQFGLTINTPHGIASFAGRV
ncbi:MAG TPA: hypothetical protein VGP04_09785 [Pseudonocardiaceae bacterium]|nr:hypothetical protein [Pseudonocardiaceae bacterium]